MPQHVWAKVANPATFTNPHPVASGPFTTIARFTTQDYVFSKNPHYWQAGKPLIGCLEYVQASSNDAALALIQSGQVDWTHNFVPNVAQAYESKDKAHYHSFYATTAYPISLTLDTTQYPYSLVSFRKALSMAIDRNTVSKLGEYGYAPPTDAIGISGLFPQWVTDATVKAQAKALATYNPTAAKKHAHLQRVHVQGQPADRPEGQPGQPRHPRHLGLVGLGRVEPDHHEEPPGDRHRLEREARARLELVVSERVRHEVPDAALAERLAGLAVRVLLLEHVEQRVHRAGAGWDEHRQLDPLQERPGDRAARRSGRPRSTATSSTRSRRKLEQLWLQQFPLVPLFIGPRWSTYSTKYFHCFNSPKNHFGDPIFSTFPDNILSFTRICPGGQAGQ